MHHSNCETAHQFPVFSTLPADEYALLEIDHQRKIERETYVYFEAFKHPNIYMVKSGLIRLGFLDVDGNKVVKEIIHSGDFFGQISLEKENLNGEFAQAIRGDVQILSFTLTRFYQLMNDHPLLALKYSKSMAARIRRSETRLENILRNDVKTRLKIFLEQLLSDVLDSARWFGKEVRVPNYLTHGEVAQLIGTSRQTVTSLLGLLKEERVCNFSRKELRFFNRQMPDRTKVSLNYTQ